MTQLQHGNAQEICEILFKGKSLEEVKAIAIDLFDQALDHPWTDDDLKNNIVQNICKQYKLIPPPDMAEDDDLDLDDLDDEELDDEGEKMLDIQYKCPKCSHEWEEQWTSACDSTCPNCGTKNIEALSWDDAE